MEKQFMNKYSLYSWGAIITMAALAKYGGKSYSSMAEIPLKDLCAELTKRLAR